MTRTKAILVILIIAFSGCKQASPKPSFKVVPKDADARMSQGAKLTAQWSDEYQKAFTEENRAKFPGNRDSLRASADKIIAILDESSSLDRRTAEEFEDASELSTEEQDKRGLALVATSLRMNIESNELIKAQLRLVYDEEIKDGKTLSEKMNQAWQPVLAKQRESEEKFKEGKRLLGN